MPRVAQLLCVGTLVAFALSKFGVLGWGPRLDYGLIGAWLFVVSVGFGLWYGRRFAATWRDSLPTIIALVGLNAAPFVLPCFVFTEEPFGLMTAAGAATIQTIAAIGALSLQGRYLFTDRPFPELSGQPRKVVEAALDRAEIEPLSLHSAPLNNFNAFVQGVGRCSVVVDRRASESLSDDQLSALIGHECGHVRTGGVLPYVAAIPTAAVITQLVHGVTGRFLLVVETLGLWWLLYFAIAQSLEFYCDRFAAKRFTGEATARLLERLHLDMPDTLRRLLERPWFWSVCSHPPLAVRVAELRAGDDSRSGHLFRRRFTVAWIVGLTLVVAPLVIRFVDTDAARAVQPWCSWVGPSLFISVAMTFRVLLVRGQRRRQLAFFDGVPERLFGWPALILITIAAFGVVVLARNGTVHHPGLGTVTMLTFAALLAHLIHRLVVVRRSRRSMFSLPARVRARVVAASAATEEARPDEAEAILDQLSEVDRQRPWVVTARAAARLRLGDSDLAASELDALLAVDPDFAPAIYFRLAVAVVRSEIELAETLATDLRARFAQYQEVAYLCGCAMLEASDFDRARTDFEAELAIRPGSAAARAGRVIARERAGEADDDRESLASLVAESAEADALERGSPMVALARAIVAHRRSDEAGARAAYEHSVDRLRERGDRGWIVVHDRWAARWGLAPTAAPL